MNPKGKLHAKVDRITVSCSVTRTSTYFYRALVRGDAPWRQNCKQERQEICLEAPEVARHEDLQTEWMSDTKCLLRRVKTTQRSGFASNKTNQPDGSVFRPQQQSFAQIRQDLHPRRPTRYHKHTHNEIYIPPSSHSSHALRRQEWFIWQWERVVDLWEM
jgi:hypothetical protein